MMLPAHTQVYNSAMPMGLLRMAGLFPRHVPVATELMMSYRCNVLEQMGIGQGMPGTTLSYPRAKQPGGRREELWVQSPLAQTQQQSIDPLLHIAGHVIAWTLPDVNWRAHHRVVKSIWEHLIVFCSWLCHVNLASALFEPLLRPGSNPEVISQHSMPAVKAKGLEC